MHPPLTVEDLVGGRRGAHAKTRSPRGIFVWQCNTYGCDSTISDFDAAARLGSAAKDAADGAGRGPPPEQR
eukprot:11813692-Alexandrium_andersonii.AAC.1